MPDGERFEERDKRLLKDIIPDISKDVEEEPPDLFGPPKKEKSKPISPFSKLIVFGIILLALVFFITSYEFSRTIKGKSEIIPQSISVINAKEEGVLKFIRKKYGARVEKGKLITKLVNTEISSGLEAASENLIAKQNNLQQVEEELVYIKRHLARQEALYKSGAVSLQKLEAARLKLQNMQLEKKITQNEIAVIKSKIENLKERREALNIYSPQDGVIIDKIQQLQGTYLNKGDDICRVADMLPLRLQFLLPEENLPLVKIGQRATVIYVVEPGLSYEAQVVQIEPQIYTEEETSRRKTNVVAVIIEPVEVPPFPVKMGMTAHTKIYTVNQTLIEIIFDKLY